MLITHPIPCLTRPQALLQRLLVRAGDGAGEVRHRPHAEALRRRRRALPLQGPCLAWWTHTCINLTTHTTLLTDPYPRSSTQLHQQGNVTVLGRESPFALYSADLASMEIEGGGAAFDYNPYDAQVRLSVAVYGLVCVIRLTNCYNRIPPLAYTRHTGLHPHQRRAAPRVQPPPAHVRLQVKHAGGVST